MFIRSINTAYKHALSISYYNSNIVFCGVLQHDMGRGDMGRGGAAWFVSVFMFIGDLSHCTVCTLSTNSEMK